ncbi:hypothetical protein F4801DRAFT_321924 [Xylaria longipes]|nr:hypothetical protein F4801DRAFT_321924 [Xylaria longipes]
MPPRKSSDLASTRAVPKPRAKRSVKCEEAEPTPAQKKRQERQDMLNAAKKRQARCLETPDELEDNGFLAKAALFTQQLPAYPSYDERPNKRKRVDHGPKTKKLARRAPWDKDSKFKKPSLPPNPPVGTLSRGHDPIAAMGRIGKLPAEIRDEILRYLLRWPHEIIVFDGWSRVFPRSRPRLNLSILYTCQVLREQGLRILFGENNFAYDLRDPAASHGHTNPVLDKVFGNSVVPINEYGHLIRYVKIKVHRSRIHFSDHRRKFEDAMLKFLPGGGLAHAAKLHTLTLEVPAETNSDLQSRRGKPNEVPICQYLGKGSRLIDTLFRLQIQWVRVLAWDTFGQCWRTEVDMRYFAKDEQMRLEHIALDKNQKFNEADTNNQSIQGDPAAAACYRTKDIKAMEKLWNNQVKHAVGQLRNLAWRIEGLAVDPDRALKLLYHDRKLLDRDRKLWEPVSPSADSGPDNHDRDELVSLPSNFREPSLSLRTRSGRGRTTPRSSNPDARKMPTRSKTKSKTKAGTVTGTSLNLLDVFNAKDTAKEARLLEAQQDIQMNEAELGERGMLTEQWLENLPQYGTKDIQGSMGNDELETNTADIEQ